MPKNSKVVLIHSPCPELEDDRLEPPLGLLYLAGAIQQHGLTCEICDLSGVPEERWQRFIPQASVYGFSTYSVSYPKTLRLRDLALWVSPGAVTVAGGPHATALPNECTRDFDVVITGEAEVTAPPVFRALLGGACVRGIYNGIPCESLDALPFPDYGFVDLSTYSRIVEGQRSISILTSRGCPFNCAHCNSRVFSRGVLRFRSPGNVVGEIRQLKDRYDLNSFRFNDDLFTFSQARIEEMTAALAPLDIRYRVFARSNSLTPRACERLYASGCRHVAIGIEHMNRKMLRLMQKGTTSEINAAALRNAKAAGLTTRIYMLVGFPGETQETFRESLDRILECEFDEFIVYPFIPYPGTAVWRDPDRFGATIDRDFSQFVQIGRQRRTCFAVTTKDFTPADVEDWRKEMIQALEKRVTWAGQSPVNR